MNLEFLLKKIYAPRGMTSVIQGLVNNDFSVLNNPTAIGTSIVDVEEKIKKYRKDLEECKSDWSYWSILSDLTFWEMVANILKGAELVGPENLPEIEYNNEGGVVMDAIGYNEKFGVEFLAKCKDISERGKNKQLTFEEFFRMRHPGIYENVLMAYKLHHNNPEQKKQ